MFFRLKGFLFYLLLLVSYSHGLQAQSAQSLLDAGQQQWLQAQYDSAYALFRAAGKDAKQAADQGAWAQSLFLSGKYLTRQMQLDAAKATLDSAIAMQATVGWDHPAVILARRERASLPLYEGEIDSAMRRYAILVEDCKRLSADKDSLRAMCLHGFSIAKTAVGAWDEALALAQEALDIRKRIFHPMHLTIGYSENSIGVAYNWSDQYEKSLQHYLQAERILGHHLGVEHPQLIQIRTNIAINYEDVGFYWKALTYHEANMAYVDKLPLQPALGVLLNYAPTLSSVGDYKTALEVLDRAESLLKANPGVFPERMAYIFGERSAIYNELDQVDSALLNINQSLAKLTAVLGKDNYQLILEHERRGHLLLKKKELEAA